MKEVFLNIKELARSIYLGQRFYFDTDRLHFISIIDDMKGNLDKIYKSIDIIYSNIDKKICEKFLEAEKQYKSHGSPDKEVFKCIRTISETSSRYKRATDEYDALIHDAEIIERDCDFVLNKLRYEIFKDVVKEIEINIAAKALKKINKK